MIDLSFPENCSDKSSRDCKSGTPDFKRTANCFVKKIISLKGTGLSNKDVKKEDVELESLLILISKGYKPFAVS